MYEHFYGLREPPFELTPNPRFLLLTPGHREALSNLEYGITARRGITLLVGEAGTGKTTLLRKALTAGAEQGARATSSIYLNNPALTRAEFFEFLAASFKLDADAASSKARFLQNAEEALLHRHRHGTSTVLVIDEAQSLPDELLEEVRLLANIESDTEKLLPLVLAGQPELAERLNRPHLRQLKQRVALRCALPSLSLRETAAYIAGRVRLAGGDAARLFSREAVIAIFEHARGIPRVISVICDNALVTGFAVGRRPVDNDLIEEVCRDFDLVASSPARHPAIPAGAPDNEKTKPANVRAFPPVTALPSARRGWPGVARRLWESRSR